VQAGSPISYRLSEFFPFFVSLDSRQIHRRAELKLARLSDTQKIVAGLYQTPNVIKGVRRDERLYSKA
jgi:hypothetical protein